jgi:arginyl-tRNA synthetase
MLIRERLAAELAAAVSRVRGDQADLPAIQLDVPPSPELGDFSSDIALTLARQSGDSAAQVAQALARDIPAPSGLLERVEVSSSGFLNFRLRPDWLETTLALILEQGDDYGRCPDLGNGEKVLVEFVSASPTGPLTVGHGRGAALGDALASVLEWNGYEVSRESYVNDAGHQFDRFGRTLEAHYLRELGKPAPMPLDGYQGEEVVELARRLRERLGDSLALLPAEERREQMAREGVAAVLAQQQQVLEQFGVRLDAWYSEHSLYAHGQVDAAVSALRAKGDAYDDEGAVWLRSVAHGDGEDRALIRSNGRPTYLAGDLAYHLDKRQRGFGRMIDVWNAEHAGYVQRTRAGIEALGIPEEDLEILIFQPVALKVQGTVVEGAMLAGNIVLLREVIEEVGRDAARFFYLRKPAGATLELDLDLAKRQDAENPYVAVRDAWRSANSGGSGDGTDDAGAQALLRRLATFPDEIRGAARERDAYRLTRYAVETAAAYERLRADRGSAPEKLARATAIVLRNTLRVIGVEPTGV